MATIIKIQLIDKETTGQRWSAVEYQFLSDELSGWLARLFSLSIK
jgi:hypothetical protein